MIHRVLTGSLLGILIGFIYFATAWGVADVLAERAHNEMQPVITPVVWTNTRDTLLWALRLEPRNPKILEMLGKVYYWQANKMETNVATQLAARRQALAYFSLATEQRPLSAYLWINVVTLKYSLSEIDEQFVAALQHASLSNPWEPFIQRTIVDVGLAAWYRLSEKGQLIILATLKRGMQKQSKALVTLVEKYERKAVICTYSEDLAKFAFCH